METQILQINQIEKAAGILRAGGLVVFPTETVYGLGASAWDETAIKKIYLAKGRPSDNPLIVHIADLEDLDDLVDEVPALARDLMTAFWPGPLTLVLKKAQKVSPLITGGLDTVAVRMPSHPVARALIRSAGVPVVAPSANLSGKPSPTTDAHVIDDLGGRVEAILLGGRVTMGLESTVVDCTRDIPTILRPGFITLEDLLAFVPGVRGATREVDPQAAPPSPGMKYRHYSPKADLVMLSGRVSAGRLRTLMAAYQMEGKRVGLMMTSEILEDFRGVPVCDLGPATDLAGVAGGIFSCLRQLDARGVGVIITRSFPKEGIGAAIMNRLEKAASLTIDEEGGNDL